MAASERALVAASLLIRLLTLLLLVASIVIIVTDKVYLGPLIELEDPPNFTFRQYKSYKYALAAAVIGCAYTLLVLPFAVIHVAQRRKIARGAATVLVIFTDAVFGVLIATGAAAGIVVTVELPRGFTTDSHFKNFFNMMYLSCGLMLGATVCVVIMITMSAQLLVN